LIIEGDCGNSQVPARKWIADNLSARDVFFELYPYIEAALLGNNHDLGLKEKNID
jgi:hypothetical protein